MANARKIFIRILVILAAVVTGILLIRAVLNYTTGKKLESYLAKAKAEGLALKMKDLVPTCPDADNGAVLWKAAESLVRVESEERGPLGKAIESFFNGRPIDESSRKILVQAVDRNRKMLEIMTEAGAKPCFVYRDWNQPSSEGKIINAVPMIVATRLLAVDAVLRADGGDVKGALDECRAGMRFTKNVLGDAPFLITGLVALADMKMSLIALNQVARGREIAPDVLVEWMKELDPHAWRSQYSRWVTGERAFSLETGLDLIRGGPLTPDATSGLGLDANTGLHRFGNRLFHWLIRPLLKSEVIWVQRHYEKLKGIARLDYYKVREDLKLLAQQIDPPPWYYRVIGGLLPNVHPAVMKEATVEAIMLATKAGLACKVYRQKNGRYPETLAALVPELLDSEPIDPFTGKPLVYKIENGELVIYSLGSNQKDDGGRGTYMITQLVMEKDDDWAWREKIR
jgi:hypothetical protein